MIGGVVVKLSNICKSIALAAVVFTTSYTNVSADNLDPYRNMVANNHFTLKFDNITPAPRNKNGDVQYMVGSSMNISTASFLLNKATTCIIVADGDKRYEEIAMGEVNFGNTAAMPAPGTMMITSGLFGIGSVKPGAGATCRLRLGDDTFNFTKYTKDGKSTYYGMVGNETKKNEVTADYTDAMAIAVSGGGFGADDATIMLNAMLPNDNRLADSAQYDKIGEGDLEKGINYIDYKSHYKGRLQLIRYYFQGKDMVKIAAGFYDTNASGDVVSGRHCILKITEFSDTVDNKYLRLPDGVKDKTDYKKREENK